MDGRAGPEGLRPAESTFRSAYGSMLRRYAEVHPELLRAAALRVLTEVPEGRVRLLTADEAMMVIGLRRASFDPELQRTAREASQAVMAGEAIIALDDERNRILVVPVERLDRELRRRAD